MANYVDTYRESLARLVAEHSAFFDRFYQLFIASNDEVAAKFEGVDLEHQKRVLRESLKELTFFFLDHEITAYMERLARVHSKHERDIRPGLYDLWLDKLIQAAREIDDQFGDADELAWRLVLAPGIEFMKFRYDHQEAS